MANLRTMLKHTHIAFSLNLPDSGRRVLKSGLRLWLPPLLALGWLGGAWGDTLSDPTQPPPAWLAAQGTAAALVDHDVSSGMQLILIGRSRKFAIIDGRVVKPGDTYKGSKVLDIKPGEVVVQDASKSLKLTPSVEKKVIMSVPLRKTGGAASKGKKLVNRNGGSQ